MPLMAPFHWLDRPFRVKLLWNSRSSRRLSSRLFLTSWIWKRNRDKLKLDKMKNLREKLPWQRRRDSKKRFFQELELPSLRSFRRRKLLRNLRPKEWSRSSWLLRLFKRQRLRLPRRLLPKPTSQDLRESMSFREERPRPNFKCLRSSSKWKLSRLLNLKNLDLSRSSRMLTNRNN